ncbi:MAG: M48 family metallopeptidase [Proteobacteria bacterium]|nr:M48 family metallopeptidase [Pseudomonadota bacterium]
MPESTPALLRARWYDGRSSQPQPVLVGLEPGARGPGLRLHPLMPGTAVPAPFAHDEVEWPEAWRPSRAQRTVVVDLRQAGSLEIDDGAQWHAALEAAGARPGLAQRMQTRWRVFAGVLLAAVLGLALFYRYGTPWAATQLTRFVPLGWEQSISQEAMRELDDGFLKPSRLPAERQAALRARFDTLAAQLGTGEASSLHRYRGYAPRFALAFRSGMPANAFALPGGQVVVTDALVNEATRAGLSDDALVGVLAHEMGHVVHRHGTRLVVEQGVLNVGLGLALGDVSNLVSMASTVLTGLAYRRNHEREADCFAARLMQRAGLPVAPMADLLMHIDGPPTGGKDTAPASKDGAAPQNADSARTRTAADWLSSHPDTAARAQALKEGRGCARP